ncbi:MAG: helix-turn-helix domain-containing protein [Planctomycetes bacterium]|nr:helix-turn-helix domain-containing protein [Planctomycetota bacterium]
MDAKTTLKSIRTRANVSQERLARILGVSFVSVNRWERGVAEPSLSVQKRISELWDRMSKDGPAGIDRAIHGDRAFASRGARRKDKLLPLFDAPPPPPILTHEPLPAILTRVCREGCYTSQGREAVSEIVRAHRGKATPDMPPVGVGVSAGKNTYAYDAHTYHTKVPPQGIAELLRHYLPEGGLVLDPFSGSGMTGVAASTLGVDSILNEISPAACFIASRFTAKLCPRAFEGAVRSILAQLADLRCRLYTTTCATCKRDAEVAYTVWSYNVICPHCGHEILLWDHCRRYGRRVRDHKILKSFPCPRCGRILNKSRLRRTIAEPVLIGYKCCGSRQQESTKTPDQADLERMLCIEICPPLAEGFYPTTPLPDGVNLRQPKRHGLDSISKLYSPRNLAAMSHLWRAIHLVKDPEIAAHLAFVFTSLYQRVTRLSEFRFWGGSGNTARLNVPFIFNEANVFGTFERKARSIQDHLETTAGHYSGKTVVVQGSATRMDYLPDACIDLVFADPPFGANINYSEMNLLWESWLGSRTDTREEAIINRFQGKTLSEYALLMQQALRECHRVLRPGHWMLLVFMNSSSKVWHVVREAIELAGFSIERRDIFDKEHGTFKQHVSHNTPGSDLVLHCRKARGIRQEAASTLGMQVSHGAIEEDIAAFLRSRKIESYVQTYLHVDREEEVDFRRLYSEWVAEALADRRSVVDFPEFRLTATRWIGTGQSGS